MQHWLFHHRHSHLAVLITGASVAVSASVPLQYQDLPPLQISSGLQLLIDQENAAPTLRVILPGRSASDRTIEILFPEHITVVQHGSTTPQRLYVGGRASGPVRRSGAAPRHRSNMSKISPGPYIYSRAAR